MASGKITAGKIAGIIFCLLAVAAAVAVIVASSTLRACRKTLDMYINGVSRQSWSSRNALYADTIKDDPEIISVEEQEAWMKNRYGALPGYDENGVRIKYKITEFTDVGAIAVMGADGFTDMRTMLLQVSCKGGGKEEKAEVMADFYKSGGKWYLVNDFLSAIPAKGN